MNSNRIAPLAVAAMAFAAACTPSAEHQRADSTALAASTQQAALAAQLSAQKDSLTRVVLQADDFIIHIDSSVSAAKGMPKGKRSDSALDPLARQIENRKLVMARVDALVERTRQTSVQLAAARKTNSSLRTQISNDSALIADLNVTIKRQNGTIELLSQRIDSLSNATQVLAASLNETKNTLANVENERHKVYYVVGREDELVQRGVIVREGGANLLFAHPGRTLQIARTPALDAFTPVDQREMHLIQMPDTTRRYRVVSRQSLDNAVVHDRDRNSFRGNLKISDASRFWAPSRYLVLVEQ